MTLVETNGGPVEVGTSRGCVPLVTFDASPFMRFADRRDPYGARCHLTPGQARAFAAALVLNAAAAEVESHAAAARDREGWAGLNVASLDGAGG